MYTAEEKKRRSHIMNYYEYKYLNILYSECTRMSVWQ